MHRRVSGFSLIELMVVVAIVAILAGIAYPSYQNHVQKTRRAEAKEALATIATQQERWFFQYNQYSTDLSALGWTASGGNYFTREGNYQITVNNQPCGDTNCFRLLATAVGVQAEDEKCAVLTLQHTGLKRSFDNTNAETTTSARCW